MNLRVRFWYSKINLFIIAGWWGSLTVVNKSPPRFWIFLLCTTEPLFRTKPNLQCSADKIILNVNSFKKMYSLIFKKYHSMKCKTKIEVNKSVFLFRASEFIWEAFFFYTLNDCHFPALQKTMNQLVIQRSWLIPFIVGMFFVLRYVSSGSSEYKKHTNDKGHNSLGFVGLWVASLS